MDGPIEVVNDAVREGAPSWPPSGGPGARVLRNSRPTDGYCTSTCLDPGGQAVADR
jgi:hypothetical protein